MKKTIILLASLAAISNIFAQNGGFAKGQKLLNLGIGVNSFYSRGIPLGASFEVGITDEISVGGNVDYLSTKYNFGDGSFSKFTALYVGARGSYHFNELLNIENEKIDLFAGGTLGFRVLTYRDEFSSFSYTGLFGNGLFLGAFIGGRYYFNKKVGAFLELGAIGSTNARLGVSFKF